MTTASLITKAYELSAEFGDQSQVLIDLAGSGDLLTPLDFFLKQLDNTPIILYWYMDQEKKKQFQNHINATLILLEAQKRLELQRQKKENKKKYDEYIRQCKEHRKAITIHVPSSYILEERPVKYLGISLGQWFADQIMALMDRKTKVIKENMGWFNEKRLYWVWGSSLLKKVLSLAPNDFYNVGDATSLASVPDLTMGYLSWTLYYFRFALNLSLLLKHTIPGFWMSDEEAKIPWTERFLTQWNQRKFSLLNDFLWATANLICFKWLTVASGLDTWGDLLTLALLLFDVSMAVWDFCEQRTNFNKEMSDYDQEILAHNAAIRELEDKISNIEDKKLKIQYEESKRQHEISRNSLKKAQLECQRNWDTYKYNLYNNLGYAIGLCLAFALFTTPFIPIEGLALTAINVTGVVLCFALTVLYNAIKGGIEIHKSKVTRQEIKDAIKEKEILFKELLDDPNKQNELKFLYLEILQLKADSSYQKQMAVYQTQHLVRSIIFESLSPAIVFASLVFLPIGSGMKAIGSMISMALASNLLINQLASPEKEKIESFDEGKFNAFKQRIANKPACNVGLFGQRRDEISLEDLSRLDLGPAG